MVIAIYKHVMMMMMIIMMMMVMMVKTMMMMTMIVLDGKHDLLLSALFMTVTEK